MKLIALHQSDQNRAMLDPWSTVHWGMGMAAGLTGTPLWLALGAAVAYEVAEQVFEDSEVGKRLFAVSGPETLSNSVADVVLFAAAWWLGRRYKQQ